MTAGSVLDQPLSLSYVTSKLNTWHPGWSHSTYSATAHVHVLQPVLVKQPSLKTAAAGLRGPAAGPVSCWDLPAKLAALGLCSCTLGMAYTEHHCGCVCVGWRPILQQCRLQVSVCCVNWDHAAGCVYTAAVKQPQKGNDFDQPQAVGLHVTQL